MAIITGAVVLVQESGQELRSECFGNNAAIECPSCLKYPVILIARRYQRGSSARNPGICRNCGCGIYITADLSHGPLTVLTVATT